MSSLRFSAASRKLIVTAAQDYPITKLRYVSGERVQAFKKLNIETVRDLFLWLPFRYIDLSSLTPIARLVLGKTATIAGMVDRIEHKQPRPRLDIINIYVKDTSGVMRLTFFKQPWILQRIQVGERIVATGKVSMYGGFKQITSPLFEVVDAEKPTRTPAEKPAGISAATPDAETARAHSTSTTSGSPIMQEYHAKTPIMPVHHTCEGLSVGWMRRIMSEALQLYGERLDYVPAYLIARNNLMTLAQALRQAQFPTSLAEAERARKRLAYDELLCLQVALRTRKELLKNNQLRASHEEAGQAHTIHGAHYNLLMEALPFTLTDEQKEALEAIAEDMGAPKRMNRLLLGDVGTGKTIVAAFALACAADTHTQAAVMAPTSVLAFQYAEKLGPLLDAAGISWCSLTSATPAKERRELLGKIQKGEVTVVFGTTALLSEDVQFHNLSLIVVDEQHRFGVNQRAALKTKGEVPDMLSMSATPIPRTLALSIYGDLDVSTIRTRPTKGAGTSTKIVSEANLDKAYKSIKAAIDAGQQAYVICPIIEPQDICTEEFDQNDYMLGDNASVDVGSIPRNLAAAIPTFKRFQERLFPGARVGLLTGRMSAQEKDEVMKAFYDGKIQILISTTVVEVGVDVPNATCMLIMDADRFGLATLHQLRGRVGRGNTAGDVLVHTRAKQGSPARKRLALLEKTSNGSELAELDLKLRHEGEILGFRQSGHANLRFVDFATDFDVIEAARKDALELLASQEYLQSGLSLPLIHEINERYSSYFSGETVH